MVQMDDVMPFVLLEYVCDISTRGFSVNRLELHLTSMVALENRIEATLDEATELKIDHVVTATALKNLHSTAKGQRAVLAARLKAIGGDVPVSSNHIPGTVGEMLGTGDTSLLSTRLHFISTLLNQAIFGYAILQPLTHRYRDSKVSGEENTGDISDQHTRNYTAAAQELNQLIHDVVLWELNRAGDECRCSCPSCTLGVCLCAASSRAILHGAWAEASPAVVEGLLVHLPRSGSAAANAGMREGDIVMAADGEEILTPANLQDAIRQHESGEIIRLQVRRDETGTIEIDVARA